VTHAINYLLRERISIFQRTFIGKDAIISVTMTFAKNVMINSLISIIRTRRMKVTILHIKWMIYMYHIQKKINVNGNFNKDQINSTN